MIQDERRAMTTMGTGRLLVMAVTLALISSLLIATPGLAADDLEDGCPADLMPTGSFEDVGSDSVHYAGIECIAFHGVTEGISEGLYGPDRAVTRGQMATFIARVVDASAATLPSADASFDDVGSGNVHADAIERLATAGITQGRDDGTFEPSGGITRAQMATFLRQAYEYITGTTLDDSTSHFDDTASSVHEGNINAVTQAGFAQGVGGREYAPQRGVVRAQMGSFLAGKIDRLAGEDHFEVPGQPASYLSEMGAVDNSRSWRDTSVRIDAVDYARSVQITSPGAISIAGNTWWRDYNLNRDYDVFRAVIGIADSSETGSRAEFTVTVDGREELSRQVDLAESLEIEVDVEDAARLRVQVTGLEGRPFAAYGNARLLVEDGSDDVNRFTERVIRSPQVYLSETASVDNSRSWRDTSVRIDAVDYARSVQITSPGAISIAGNTWWREYNLSRDYDVFRAVIGIADGSETGSRAEFTVTVDGREAFSGQVDMFESEEIEVDVTDAFRIRVQVTGVEGRPGAAYGNAQLLKLEEG